MMQPPPVISAKSLGAMPLFALQELGERKTLKTLKDVGLPEEFLERRDGYIPEQALAGFIGVIGRELGQEGLGLLWAPLLTVADYGSWGSYVLTAPTLGEALARAKRVMPLHSNSDRVVMKVANGLVTYSYLFGLTSHEAYADVAYSALASMLSIHRHYLGASWRPRELWVDTPRPARPHLAEEAFGCPVKFNMTSLSILFDTNLLSTPQASPRPEDLVTVEDIQRERQDGPAQTFEKAVRDLILLQLSEQTVSIDRAALAFQTGVRTLQRRLAAEGTTFRDVLNRAKIQRAQELLSLGSVSVTTVSDVLGYNSPGNFSRAFGNGVGCSPRQFSVSRRANG